MSNVLQTGAAWLASQAKASMSDACIYRRGASSVSISATVGKYMLRVNNNNAEQTLFTDASFVFTAADLTFDHGATLTEPAKGDTIERLEADGVTRQYILLPYGADEPLFRYTDGTRLMIRAHTKFKGTV